MLLTLFYSPRSNVDHRHEFYILSWLTLSLNFFNKEDIKFFKVISGVGKFWAEFFMVLDMI